MFGIIVVAASIAAVLVVLAGIRKERKHSQTSGNLRYQFTIALLGLVLFLLSSVIFAVMVRDCALLFDHCDWRNPDIAHIAAFAAVGGLIWLPGIWLIMEYFFVHGFFDRKGIRLQTLWSGSKEELWSDLVSAKYNFVGRWYVLRFSSGRKIRLSTQLLGVWSALDDIKSAGIDVE